MPPHVTIDAIAEAIAGELTGVCGSRLGADATSAPTDLPNAAGWTLTIPVSGAVEGRVAAWFDGPSAAACARAIAKLDETPSDETIANLLTELVHDAITAVNGRLDCADVRFGAPVVGQGHAAAGARAFYIAVPNLASCVLAVGVERPVAARPDDDRWGAVLDVDLPLTVRFGRAVMPLHAIAELGPGSVIDMGRSPDEPVDLLVGERVIARGDVVVVGGNYGVRITQLVSGREAAAASREARTR